MKPTLYRHFSKDGTLLYVGASLCVLQRQITHSMMARWFDDVVMITMQQCANQAELLDAEKAAIMNEKPVHNTAHNRLTATRKFANPENNYANWSPVERYRYLKLTTMERQIIRRDKRSASTIADDYSMTERMIVFIQEGMKCT